MKKRTIAVSIIAVFSFGGCSAMFNVGHDKGICEEKGCDYSDAGVCGDSYMIYKNWKDAEKEAYKDYKGKDKSRFSGVDNNTREIIIDEE